MRWFGRVEICLFAVDLLRLVAFLMNVAAVDGFAWLVLRTLMVVMVGGWMDVVRRLTIC